MIPFSSRMLSSHRTKPSAGLSCDAVLGTSSLVESFELMSIVADGRDFPHGHFSKGAPYEEGCVQHGLCRRPAPVTPLSDDESDCDTSSIIETDQETTSCYRSLTDSFSTLSVSDGNYQLVPAANTGVGGSDRRIDLLIGRELVKVPSFTRLVDWVDSVKTTCPGGRRCGTGEGMQQSQPPSGASDHVEPSVNNFNSSQGSNGKRHLTGDDPRKDADDSDSEEGRQHPKRPKAETEQTGRFACPFFKRNQKKYMKTKTCAGPGWVSVHRVK